MAETRALVNSDFETNALDITMLLNLIKKLNLQPPQTSLTVILEIDEGEIVNQYYESYGEFELILNNRENRKVKINVIVNTHIDENALSDYILSISLG